MAVRQLSVFLQNRCGRTAEVVRLLDSQDVGVVGIAVADTHSYDTHPGYGILRLLVDAPDTAERALADAGFAAIQDQVVCVDLGPGLPGLADLLADLAEACVNVDYMYVAWPGILVCKSDQPAELEAVAFAGGHRLWRPE